MEHIPIQLPETVLQKVRLLGEEGNTWLKQLPTIIAELEKIWQCRLLNILEGGTEALVATVELSTGEIAILKILMPPLEGNVIFEYQLRALEFLDGNEYARLLRSCVKHRALLMERLGTPLLQLGYATQQEMEIMCNLLQQTWVAMPDTHSFQPMSELLEWFRIFIPSSWNSLNHPCSKQVIEHALSYLSLRKIANISETAVLLHGDAHTGNVLQTISDHPPTFKLIDPDGLVGEAAYDIGILMREWIDELLENPVKKGIERCNFFGALTNLSTQSVWQWGYIQLVATGLLVMKSDDPVLGQQMLDIAEEWQHVKIFDDFCEKEPV